MSIPDDGMKNVLSATGKEVKKAGINAVHAAQRNSAVFSRQRVLRLVSKTGNALQRPVGKRKLSFRLSKQQMPKGVPVAFRAW